MITGGKLDSRPFISVVVVFFNMLREAKRTLYSLSHKFQKEVDVSDYEVIVVENGSSQPLSDDFVKSFGPNFKYFFLDARSKSPAEAMNFGVEKSRGELTGLMIDGARILSPGVLKYALLASRAYSTNPIICTLSWHLGPKPQQKSPAGGYTKEIEDRLLEDINWTDNGYRLFEKSSLAGSCKYGFFKRIAESTCFFMRKQTFVKLGGYDERFDLPGGGMVNMDLYKRACELPDTELVYILGEGTFHQMHGGVTSNISEEENILLFGRFKKQYSEIRKQDYSKPEKHPVYIGHFPQESMRFIRHSLNALDNLEPSRTGFKERMKSVLKSFR